MNKASTGIGFAAMLGMAYLGATAWTGDQVQARYAQHWEQMRARFPFVQIVPQAYERGFFTSHSSVGIQLGCGAAAEDGVDARRLVLVDTIHHGPVPGGRALGAASIDTELVLAPKVQAALEKAFDGAAPFAARTVVGFRGGFDTTVSSPPARFVGPAGKQLVWHGMTAQLHGNRDGRTLAYDVTSPGLDLSDPATASEFVVGALKWHSEGAAATPIGLLRTGSAFGTLENFRLTAPAASTAGAGVAVAPALATLGGTAMTFTAESGLDGDLLSGKVVVRGRGTAGGAQLDAFDLQVSARRLHAATYENIVADLVQSPVSCYSDQQVPSGATVLLTALEQNLASFLPYGPEVSIDRLSVTHGGQTGQLQASLGLRSLRPDDVKLPLDVLWSRRGEASLIVKLPAVWITNVARELAQPLQGATPDLAMDDSLIDRAVAQGQLVRDGEFVKSSVHFTNRKLVINGRLAPIDRP